MNNFGEFLYELRKEKGMTQAELAQLLGVTNKAVSKWETGEAMPETALLVPISRIFGVSVDELLAGERNAQADASESKERSEGCESQNGNHSIKGHLFTRGKDDGAETLSDKIKGAVCAAVVFAGLAAYFLLGICAGLWHPYWVIIPSCALFSGIVGILFELFSTEKRKIKFARGENPYTGAICGIIMLTCIITYLNLGAFLNLWHPLWIIPVAGAFVCGITAAITEIITHKK